MPAPLRKLALAVLSACLLAAGCARKSTEVARLPVPAIPPKDVLIVGKPGDANGLDPAVVSDGESSQVCRSMFDTLVRHAQDSMKLEPALATSWEVSQDGKEWTFHLRKGVKFHDGTPFNAQAVADNYLRQFRPDHPLRFSGQTFGYWADIWGSQPSSIEDVVAVDEHTVKFRLRHVVAPFLENLAMPFFGIVSPTALKKYGSDAFKNPVGTGAFRFVEWVPGERIVVERNPDYWDGAPAMEQVVFKPIKDSTSRQLQLEKGAVHLITGVMLENADRIQKAGAAQVITQPGMNVGYIAMNNMKPPFDNRLVRQAVNHALERQAIADALYYGLAEVANSHLPPMIWGHVKLKGYAYNPERARELLRDAGYPDGFKTSLWYMSAPRMYYPEPKVVAEAVQAMLGEVGIQADIRSVDWGIYLDEAGKGKHEMALGGWVGDTGDPDNYLYVMLDDDNADPVGGGSNLCFYKNPEVHKRLKGAQTLVDQAERARLYEEAQPLIEQDAPSVPLIHAHQIGAHHPALKGYMLHPTGTMILSKCSWAR